LPAAEAGTTADVHQGSTTDDILQQPDSATQRMGDIRYCNISPYIDYNL